MAAFALSGALGWQSFVPSVANARSEFPCERSTCPRVQPRASASQSEPQQTADGLFMDDPFGGFKGQRRSDSSDSWSKNGTRVRMSEKQEIFVAITGAKESRRADVLILPGFPCPSFLTRNFADRLAFLHPGVRVSAIDWPGIGDVGCALQLSSVHIEYGLCSLYKACVNLLTPLFCFCYGISFRLGTTSQAHHKTALVVWPTVSSTA